MSEEPGESLQKVCRELLKRPKKGFKVPHLGLLVLSMSSIGDALFTKTQQRVLGILFGKPDKSFYTNEIVRLADMGRGTVRRELERLVSAGILTVTVTGNQHHYQANPANPVYDELCSIVRKTFGIADVIREALEPLDSSIELAFIFGSIAKLTDVESSDVDLLLVGTNLEYRDVVGLLYPMGESLRREINPVIYAPEDFEIKRSGATGFLQRVMEQPRMMIKGTLNDAGEPGKDQAAAPGASR